MNRNELRKDSLVVFLDTLYNKMGCYIEKRENTDSETLHRTDEIGNTYRLRAGANTGKNHTVFGEKPVRRLSHAENGK